MVWLAGTRGVLSSTCQLISCFLPCVQIFFRMSWCGNIAARWQGKVCDHLFDIFDPNPPFMGNYTPWGLPLLYGSPSVQLVCSACFVESLTCSSPCLHDQVKRSLLCLLTVFLFWSEFLTFIYTVSKVQNPWFRKEMKRDHPSRAAVILSLKRKAPESCGCWRWSSCTIS